VFAELTSSFTSDCENTQTRFDERFIEIVVILDQFGEETVPAQVVFFGRQTSPKVSCTGPDGLDGFMPSLPVMRFQPLPAGG
jgi:hypothetical protein